MSLNVCKQKCFLMEYRRFHAPCNPRPSDFGGHKFGLYFYDRYGPGQLSQYSDSLRIGLVRGLNPGGGARFLAPV